MFGAGLFVGTLIVMNNGRLGECSGNLFVIVFTVFFGVAIGAEN